jgi:hypothetical protein
VRSGAPQPANVQAWPSLEAEPSVRRTQVESDPDLLAGEFSLSPLDYC